MSFAHAEAKIATEALYAVRALIQDTQPDKYFLEDQEIAYVLALRGLTETSDPVANAAKVHAVAAECAEMVAARLSSDSEVALTEVGPVKSTAAGEYRRVAAALRRKAREGTKPTFANPESYAVTHVAGVDAVPELE